MPKPGDIIILTSTLLPTYGVLPATHSCSITIYKADGTLQVATTPMTNVTGAVYKFLVDTTGWDLGGYYAIYEAIMDGSAAPPICENFYLEIGGITPADLQPVLDAISAHDSDIKAILTIIGTNVSTILTIAQQIWYTTFCHKQEALEYDSQGRTSRVTTTYSETPDFSIPVAIFVWTFTYNADNSIATLTIERTSP